jgi:hypothetical protein
LRNARDRKTEEQQTLKRRKKPIGVSDYELTRALPENLKSSLPSIEEIEAELQREIGEGDDEA